MAVTLIITDAGIAEIVNAENNGTSPVLLKSIGLGTGRYTATASQTALQAEFKRLDEIAGGDVGDDIIHVSIQDAGTDAYYVYEIGVFTESGTLFAVASQSSPIIEKAGTSVALVSIDIVLSNINPESVTVGDTNFLLNTATTEQQGIVELATEAEAKAKTDTRRAITPATLDKVIEGHDNIVHRSGAENINGEKRFLNTTIHKADLKFTTTIATDLSKEATATEFWFGDRFVDSNGVQGGQFQYFRKPNGDAEINMQVKSKASNPFGILSLIQTKDGTSYATAPNPATGDNSTKIATTSWVTAKAKEYLPLAGGTITGTISKNGGTFLNNTNSASSLVLTGDKLSHNASVLMLFGLEHSDFPGGFIVRAGDNTNSYTLLGNADGSLVWGGKNIVRSVNNVSANTAGNVTIAISNISGLQSALDGKAPTNHTHSYLPLAGGQMTATKAMSRNVNNSFLGLHGGTGENNDGAQLFLCGASHPDLPSGFQLIARNSNEVVTLQGGLDGKLTWDDKYVLNNSFMMPSDTGAIMLTAGTSSSGGAYFRLYGKGHTSGAGQFNIAATDGTNTKALVGKPDGTLTWGGKQVICVESWRSSDGSSWYRKYSDGWVEQGGIYLGETTGRNSVVTITFPVEMADTNYNVLRSFDYTGVQHSSVVDTGITSRIVTAETTYFTCWIGGNYGWQNCRWELKGFSAT